MDIFSSSTILYLISAMIAVESGGDNHAIGDNGKAYGCLQIHRIYLEDIERFGGKKYEHAEMFDRAASIEATLAYMRHYGKIIHEREGRQVTLQDLARLHNGSINLYDDPATEAYWLKVKEEYNKLAEWINIP